MNVPYKGRFRISQKYKGLQHDGFDMVGLDDKTIYSTVSGTVERAGWENASNHSQGFGQYVRVKDRNSNNRYYFGHLSKIYVKVGQTVNVGDKLGVEGNTGYSFGSHCHYCVRANGDKNSPLDISVLTGLPNVEYVTYENQETKKEVETMARYNKVKDLPEWSKADIKKIIEVSKMTGKGGTGDDKIVDFSEDMIRTMIIMKNYFDNSIQGATINLK